MSSIRLPVSTSTVAIIVRLPPSSMLRAAPKKRFGLSSAPGAKAAAHRPPAGIHRVAGARQPGQAVHQHDDVFPLLHQPLRAFVDHIRHADVVFLRRIKCRIINTVARMERLISVTSSGRSSISSTISSIS